MAQAGSSVRQLVWLEAADRRCVLGVIVEDVVLDLDVVRETQFAVGTLMGHRFLAHIRFVAPWRCPPAGPKVPILSAAPTRPTQNRP